MQLLRGFPAWFAFLAPLFSPAFYLPWRNTNSISSHAKRRHISKNIAIILRWEKDDFKSMTGIYEDMDDMLRRVLGWSTVEYIFFSRENTLTKRSMYLVGQMEGLIEKHKIDDQTLVVIYHVGHGGSSPERELMLENRHGHSDDPNDTRYMLWHTAADTVSRNKGNWVILLETCHSGLAVRYWMDDRNTVANGSSIACLTATAADESTCGEWTPSIVELLRTGLESDRCVGVESIAKDAQALWNGTEACARYSDGLKISTQFIRAGNSGDIPICKERKVV